MQKELFLRMPDGSVVAAKFHPDTVQSMLNFGWTEQPPEADESGTFEPEQKEE